MTLPAPEFLMRVVDLIIVVGVLGTVVHVLRYRILRSKIAPMTGGVLVLVGLVLAVLAYLGEAFGLIFPEIVHQAEQASFVGYTIPGWLHWILSRAAFLMVLFGLLLAAFHGKRADLAISRSAEKLNTAQDIVMESESRFRSLFETMSDSIYCYVFDPPMPVTLPLDEQVRRSHDAILTVCNEAFAKSIDGQTPGQIVGSRMRILDGNKDTEAHRSFFGSFVRNDYRLSDYELIYKSPEGADRANRVNLTGIVSDGLLLRFWGAETSILDLRQTKAALAGRRRYQELLADISSRLVTAPDEHGYEVLVQCMQELCRHVGADRTTFVWYNRVTKSVDMGYTWSVEDRGFRMPTTLTIFPQIIERLLSQAAVRIEDVDNIPPEFESDQAGLLALGVKSILTLPLVIEGEVIGVSTYSQLDDTRVWTDQELSDLQVFAELLANFVLRLRSRSALDDALTSLRSVSDRLQAENVYVREKIERTHGFDEIIGKSDEILRCLHLVEVVASTQTPVLILGETGTGKELIARAIHEHSDRRDRPLVKVNCAALPANLIESELFGYEKGAFTGAEKTKRGRFDLADGSTLFLDEIGDIPLELQAKLLRALQEGEIERLGGSKTIKVDVRIIAATNRNLFEEVSNGGFRSDLYYRINTFPIVLPPLRDRGDDIQMLSESFVKANAQKLGRDVGAMSAEMMRQLREYHWPGNVRELESVIQRALISSTGPTLELAGSLSFVGDDTEDDELRILSSTIGDLQLVERQHIVSTLDGTGWKISGNLGAAAKLGIPPSTLRSKMKKLSIVRPN